MTSAERAKDTGYACIFRGDGKPGQCDKIATWRFKKYVTLCDFHAGFWSSIDYFNEHGKPRKLK